MCKRALFDFNWSLLSTEQFAYIKQVTAQYDELIFLIGQADNNIACGELMVRLNSLFTHHFKKPFYLIPLVKKEISNLTYWLRWRILCPSFEKVYTDEPSHQHLMQTVLHIPVECFERHTNENLMTFSKERPKKTRALFITRAQPFHLGHEQIVEKMSQEVDEIIVLIAMANLSHQLDDFATGGERIEMVLASLNQLIPQRFYLCALPYNHFTMENFYELEYLLPSFDNVYTHNPQVSVLAETAGYQVRTAAIKSEISGSKIRELILRNEPYRHYLPEAVYTYLSHSNIPDRLKKLSLMEDR